MVVRSPCSLQPVKLQGSVSVSGLVVLVDEGQNIIFGQFLGVHPCLRVVDYDPVHPGPEVPLSVANTEGSSSVGWHFIGRVLGGFVEEELHFGVFAVCHRPGLIDSLHDVKAGGKEVSVVSARVGQTWDSS